MKKSLIKTDSLLLKPYKELIIRHYEITPYKIKLKQPLHTAASSLYFRQGFLIKLTTEKAYSAIGECAPMVEIGTESFAQAHYFLEHTLAMIIGQQVSIELLEEMQDFPACRFALESIFLSLVAQQKNQTISHLLNPKCASTINVNAMLGALSADISTRIKKAQNNGFKCLKIKLGLNPIKEEILQLKKIFEETSPSSLIRLDANKSWTVNETEYLLNTLEPYISQIDGIEEPLKDFDISSYQYLQSNTPIPLALDESFSRTDPLYNFPVKRLILKPMAQGGLLKTLNRARQAQQLKIETIITSSIESGYGLWAISHLCAALNNQQYHGLATACWLQDTLIKPPEIKHGCITL